jgi:hypothetical protein
MMYRSPDSNKSVNTVALERAKLVERLKQPDSNPAQLPTDLLAAQCLLGFADGGAILRANQERDIDVLAVRCKNVSRINPSMIDS